MTRDYAAAVLRERSRVFQREVERIRHLLVDGEKYEREILQAYNLAISLLEGKEDV